MSRWQHVSLQPLPPLEAFTAKYKHYLHEIAIILACTASFRQLFVNKNNQRKKAGSPGSSRRRFLSYLGLRSKGSKSKGPTDEKRQEVNDKWGSQTHIMPLDSIHVGHNISVTASEFVYGEDQQEGGRERGKGS